MPLFWKRKTGRRVPNRSKPIPIEEASTNAPNRWFGFEAARSRIRDRLCRC
jgi:hypothetical protein